MERKVNGENSILVRKRNIYLKIQISKMMKISRVSFEIKHDKAHQDDEAKREELSKYARMNCICDDAAKKCAK